MLAYAYKYIAVSEIDLTYLFNFESIAQIFRIVPAVLHPTDSPLF